MTVTTKQCTVAEFEREPNLPALLAEYEAESAVKGLPPTSAKFELYKQLEAAGMLHGIVAHEDDVLIGFISILSTVLPHYGIAVSTVESFFVTDGQRKTGTGIRLLRLAEQYAQSIGSPGLLVSAPIGGRLAELLDHSDSYTETNRVFFRRFNA